MLGLFSVRDEKNRLKIGKPQTYSFLSLVDNFVFQATPKTNILFTKNERNLLKCDLYSVCTVLKEPQKRDLESGYVLISHSRAETTMTVTAIAHFPKNQFANYGSVIVIVKPWSLYDPSCQFVVLM